MTSFSERHGLSVPDAEITVRNDAPDELRGVLPEICYKVGLGPRGVRTVLCELLFRAPDRQNWTEYPNIDDEVHRLLRECAWFEVYDAIEKLYAQFRLPQFYRAAGSSSTALEFETEINRYFRRNGIGWQLVDGAVELRGSEAFELAIRQGREELYAQGRHTASQELHEAIQDLSRRPSPEITGAIQHAMAALECVARDKCATKDTLGDLIRRNPSLFPKPVDLIIEKAWGWTSNYGRHLQEGQSPSFEEAELIVGISGVLCRYLARRL